ncbi:MAG: hypothetical protein AB4911_04430 [Oscillochloridaceae bacterium umkhey_bin13]
MGRTPLRLFATLSLMLCLVLGVILWAPARPSAAQTEAPITVYLFTGGHQPSDEAVAATLRERGFNVTVGLNTALFDGSQVNLADYKVVIPTYNNNWATPIPAQGVIALREYVLNGGSLVLGEWFGWRGQMQDLMPVVNCGWNSVGETSYTQIAPNPAINANLPTSFAFTLSNFAGTEACHIARPGASLFYASSNGGGGGIGRSGLAAWNVGAGRVAALSTLMGATELENPYYRILLQNLVAWLATGLDATPPQIETFTVSGADALVADRTVNLTFSASDTGGSGLGSYFIAEYVFSGDPSQAWRLAQTSGWQLMGTADINRTWQLDPTPGIHVLRLFVADRAGNLTRTPGSVNVNYHPATPPTLATDEIHLYLVRPGAGRQAQVIMNAVGATSNPDLYVFGPNLAFAPESDEPVEQVSFLALAGIYQIEVVGFQAGAYSLQYQLNEPAGATTAAATDDAVGIQRRGRGTPLSLVPAAPLSPPEDLPPPPVNPELLGLTKRAYLPLIIR